MATIIDEIFALYRRHGSAAYFGESVSMTEHGLQAAHFAREGGAGPALIVAALLHDVGHLVEDVPQDIADWSRDAEHERVGGAWLARRFPPQVSEPVRLHVPAKRYLLATDRDYLAKLSPASLVTLKLQGGPMSPVEALRFEAEPFCRDAVLIRRCDDRGKVPGLATPSLEDFAPMIEALARG
ncbi:MAG TPA: HD domain-containing protein [Steroidobacteraceae bacterium]|jgi:phosphonate degradation associated HDIG domain protein|nr:HD domain-containing protein [Steroidobacteraceae bacterium]